MQRGGLGEGVAAASRHEPFERSVSTDTTYEWLATHPSTRKSAPVVNAEASEAR